MDITEELYKWQQCHTKEEWELASKEIEYAMYELKSDVDEIDYFIKYNEFTYNIKLFIINRK